MRRISGCNVRLLLPIVVLISGLVVYSYGETQINGTSSKVIFRDKPDRLKSAGGKFQEAPFSKVTFVNRTYPWIVAEERFRRAANIVEAKCLEYDLKIFERMKVLHDYDGIEIETDCLRVSNFIGGSKAMPKEFQHMALLGYISGNKTDWRCGGSLISDRFVMSAAHCEPNERMRPELVLLGELDYSTNKDEARPTYYKIVERFKHPLYSPPKQVNDIILYKLNDTVKFDFYIRPICLSTSRFEVPDRYATVTGWGYLDTIEKPSGALMKGTVEIFDNEVCELTFRNHRFFSDGVDKDRMLCAGNINRREDTCHGDSGGPLQISTGKCLWRQLGIISTGSNICADADNPGGIYTKVAHYIVWIQRIVWPETK